MEQKVMNREFKKIKGKIETRYVLEAASGGATSAGSVATGPVAKDNLLVQDKEGKPEVQRRNPVAANVNATVGGGGAGAHRDRKRAEKRGEQKHKKDWRKDVDENISNNAKGVAEGTKTKTRLDPKCWKGYKKQGTKMKGGVRVNNCVPKENTNEGYGTGGYSTVVGGAQISKAVPESDKEEIRTRMQSDLDDFLRGGGKIEKLPPAKTRAKPGRGLASKHIGGHGEINRGRAGKSVGKARNVGGDKPVVGMKESLDSHYIDQENSMTSSDLKSLYKQAVRLRNLIQKMGDNTTLEPWQQTKIAKAADYVNSVFRSLDDEYSMSEAEKKGLWANIHARRKKGLPPRKPGEKGAPTKKGWDAAVSASKAKTRSNETQNDGNKVYYFYDVPRERQTQAIIAGLEKSFKGRWFSLNQENEKATKLFGPPKRWVPTQKRDLWTGKPIDENNLSEYETHTYTEKMMPASHFAGTPKNKLGPAAHLKGKMKRPARQGDLVGGSAEESAVNERYGYGSNRDYTSQGTYKRHNLFVSKKPSTLGKLNGFYLALAEHPRTMTVNYKAKGRRPEVAVAELKSLIDQAMDDAVKVTQNATVDFNVNFVKELLPAIDVQPTDFYSKIVAGPKLVIAGFEILDYPEILKSDGFKKSSIRTVKDSETTTKLPAFPLSAAAAQSAKLIANGRYVIKNEQRDKDGNFVFDLEFDSIVSAPNEKVKMGEPALTIGTVRDYSEESLSKKKDIEEKLTTNDPVDVWRDTFLKANPEQYHQFRQNNRPGTKKNKAHIIRMANSARFKAATKK